MHHSQSGLGARSYLESANAWQAFLNSMQMTSS